MLNHYLRYLAVAAFAALAFAIPVAAHHGTENVAMPQAPGPGSSTVSLQGYVDQIVVENLVTGGSRRYPIFAADDGRRLALAGPGVDSLVTGTAIKVSGKENGRALFPDSVQTIATNDSRRTVAKAVSASSFSGVLRLGHADNFDGSPSEFFFALDSGDGRHKRVELATMLGELQNGMRVNIDGRVAATGELVPERIAIVAATGTVLKADPIALGTPVTTNYLVIPIKFPTGGAGTVANPWTYGADPFTPAALNTAVFGASGSVKEYYNEVSYGQQLLSGVVADNGSGGFLQASVVAPANCDYTAVGVAAEAAATARGYNVASYTGILYVFNNVPGCGWSGLAYVGWARAWSNNTTNLLVIAHELGHNFGLAHAASLDCGANVIDATTCTSSEYGDPFDVMGNNRAMHFSSAQKSELNWLPAGSVSTHTTGTATYTLSALETAGGSHYAVKVPVAANRTYWIEYRQPIGFDAGLSAFPNNGAQIRVASPFESLCSGCYDDTEFLDLTPATAAFTDGALVVGQTYTDTTYNIAFNIVSATGGAGGQLTVQVIGGAGSPTTTTLASSLNPSTSGAGVTFTATVIGVAPTGSVNFMDGGSSVAGCSATSLTGSGNTRTVTCSTSALTAGTHNIVANYSGDAGNTGSASSALSQVVKATTSTTLATSGTPSTVGASVTFTASVTGLAPTGSINFKDGLTSITGCSAVALTGSGNTRTAACSTSALTAGTHSITAAYAGDAGNVASTSSALSQVVNAVVGASTNVALATNGGVATASSTYTAGGGLFPVSAVNNGDRAGLNWGSGGGWNDDTGGLFPDWVQINFSGQKAIDHVIVYTTQDNYASPVDPSNTLTFSLYGITDFQVQGWNGSTWVTLGSVTGNNLVKRQVNFAATTTDRIRVNITGAMASYSRITEIEAWTTTGSAVASTTALGSSPNPSGLGTNVTFTATVTGAAPTGTVNFKDGATSISGCSAITVTGSGNVRTAACVTAALTAGTHSIVATYSGDVGNVTSSSSALTQTVTGVGQINVALAGNGGVATASSTYVGAGVSFPVSAVNNGDRAGLNWGNGGGWNDGTGALNPDWVQINFSGQKTIDHVIVYTTQDNYASPVDPSNALTFSLYGITDFQVQGWNGSTWVTLGSVGGNNLVKRTVNFAATTTNRIRVNITGALAGYSRITEIEAWGN